MSTPVLKAKISGIQGARGTSNLITVEEFVFVSTDGQSTIILPSGSQYYVGTNSLFIFVNGKALSKLHYVESNNTTITLVTPFPAGLDVFVKYIKYFPSNNDLNSVIVSIDTPFSYLKEGLLWFNPVTKAFSIYSTNSGFKEFLYKEDFESRLNDLDAGLF